ncbi:acyltransferase family protein [Parvularcula oceani]|uniref:acyltransferase family protein n=1 Tax=Parvularcula oceani TaxID=1247963 RepID=UPI0004E1C7E0|nr:acyltransferase [Parvularcula oceani]
MTIETPGRPSKAAAPKKIEGIQLLRALAAILVAAFHLNGSMVNDYGYDGLLGLFRHGEAGVDLFFVISGFIILHTTLKRPEMTRNAFLEARAFRIYPIYWAILAAYLLLAVVGARFGVEAGYATDPLTVLNSAALFPYPREVITIAWTLTIEVLFYLVFALTFFRFGVKGFLTAMLAWVLLSQAVKAAGFEGPWTALTLYTGNAEFLYGALLALAFAQGRMPAALPVLLAGVVGFSAFLWTGGEGYGPLSSREFGAGIPAAAILYGILGLGGRLPRVFTLLGDASYVLYLIHLLAFSVLLRVFGSVLAQGGLLQEAALLVMLVAVTAASAIVHLLVEQPLQRWYRARRRERISATARPAAGRS